MAGKMRQADVEEIYRSGPWRPLHALLASVRASEKSFSVFDGVDSPVPVLMYGVVKRKRIFDTRAIIWMLGTDKVFSVKKRFLKQCGREMDELFSGLTVYNYIDADNKQSLRWLKWLGFDILPAEPRGWLKKPFHYIERTYPDVRTD